MKSHLSHILPVAEACAILGDPCVRRIVRSFLAFRTPNKPSLPLDPQEEILLLKALWYKSIDFYSKDDTVPAAIRTTWNKYTRRTAGLDKTQFLKWTVPAPAAPRPGPGGHLGLFDCWVYALSASANHSSTVSLAPVVLLPDFLIALAIAKQYTDAAATVQQQQQQQQSSKHPVNKEARKIDSNDKENDDDDALQQEEEDEDEEDVLTKEQDSNEAALTRLGVLAFRIYDSYQKKGAVSRDTLHRFLSDVHGEESYKAPPVQKILDRMFSINGDDLDARQHVLVGSSSPSSHHSSSSNMRSALTGNQFCRAVTATTTGTRHVLLDWIATLLGAMLSSSLHDLAPSTQAYLETIHSSQKSIDRVCQQYGLSEESSLYDVKRKFHSMVESSHSVIQGDPMMPSSEAMEDETTESPSSQEHSATARALPKRQVISQAAFCAAVCSSNEEMGHGGYLPESLAILTFQGACDVIEDDDVDVPQQQEEDGSMNGGSKYAWTLYDVLQFGCQAVRLPMKHPNTSEDSLSSEDAALLQFAFRIFGTLPGGSDSRVLTREQVARMLILILEHASFRLRADSSAEEPESEVDQGGIEQSDTLEESVVDVTAASLLGILPTGADGAKVSLKELVDGVLGDEDHLTYNGFCEWHDHRVDADLPQRLGPFLLELRLIASVVFGIPPTRASMEHALVAEVKRRHKYRYHQTDVARRGPRGTIWYIIEDRWYKAWLLCVQEAGGTDKDAQDGRNVPHQLPRGLGKILNTALLAENGTLALRPDIRWRHDYEILPPLAWSALQAWYDGGPPISRMVVPYIPTTGAPSPHSRAPRVRTEYEIELYPYFVTVFMCDASSRGEARPFQQYVPVSRVCPVRVLLVQLSKGLEIDPKFGRLWMMEKHSSEADWLMNLDENIVEQRQRRGHAVDGHGSSINLLLEIKDEETGKWPRGLDGKSWTFRNKGRDGRALPQSETGDGIVGLYNMGNTCYLNSSIQCLSHTPVFRDYFTSKVYLHDINTTNPLGHQGRLAQVSAVLINNLWKNFSHSTPHHPKRVMAPGSYAPVPCPALTPKTFKDSLGRFNDHFSGNEQHDAQELLAFLLGGLSEDLNRIVDKPYIEAPDSDGRPDSELADIWWTNHLKREMSIIVALFTGQYKSLLTCRSCKYESARFEPFSFLQVPLPEDDQISVSVVFYPLKDGMDPTKYSVKVRHDGRLLDVLISLAKVLRQDETAESTSSDPVPDADSKIKDEGKEEEGDSLLQEELQRRAQSMAVVDLREGYIFKIAPNSWALPDLQNKDTGELPPLHIYELEPLPAVSMGIATSATVKNANMMQEKKVPEADGGTTDDTASAEERNDSSKTGDFDEEDEFANVKRVESDHRISEDQNVGGDNRSDLKYSFLACSQRRSELISSEFLHPFTHQVFGTPLLLRVVDLEGYSGRDLYDLVAKRIRNFVPKAALRFLADNSDAPRDASTDDDDESESDDSAIRPRAGTRQRRRQTTSDMEEVSAGPVPRYGFRLRITSRDGRRCALCPWFECCIGCLVPDDDYPTMVMCGDSIVIDWHFAVDIATAGFGARHNKLDTPGPQSPFRAKPPPIAIKSHRSCGDQKKRTKGYEGAITLEDCLDAFAKEERIPEAYCSKCKDFRVQTKRMSLWRLPPVMIIHLKRFQFTQHMRRKLRELVVFPLEGLDLERIMASDSVGPEHALKSANGQSPRKELEETEDDTTSVEEEENDLRSSSSRLSPSNCTGRSEMLYDLYGVVHHQGALSGGHYVASLKSELDGQWRLFNDAQVYEIHSRDVVDSSAYILFYIRRDVKGATLQDFWDVVGREGEGLSEEDMEKLMKGRSDRCVIS